MPHQLSWYKENEIICLELLESLSPEELQTINHSIIDLLNTSLQKLVLLVNAEQISIGHQTVNLLRASQKYANHPRLKTMLTYAPDKLTRLVFLMAFSIASTNIIQFEDTEQLNRYLQRMNQPTTH